MLAVGALVQQHEPAVEDLVGAHLGEATYEAAGERTMEPAKRGLHGSTSSSRPSESECGDTCGHSTYLAVVKPGIANAFTRTPLLYAPSVSVPPERLRANLALTLESFDSA